ncbi:MAG: transporter substrate-binding domain-containing protein [Myxococcota bacterium]|jgi:membrane-bound lytic murein transglycosylase MltF
MVIIPRQNGGHLTWLAFLVFIAAVPPAFAQSSDKPALPAEDGARQPRGLILNSTEWKGDFDRMLEFRRIRVLVPQSRALYFADRGRERGFAGEAVRDFERYLNKKFKKELGKRPLTVFIVPTTRDALISGVAGGLGDIAAGDITQTGERQKQVDFVAPRKMAPMFELLLTGPKSPAVGTIDDLSGKTVHVRRSTSYFESLSSLSERFRQEGRAPVNIVTVPDALEDEDMMDMLGAGLFEFIVVDDQVAKTWAQLLPQIVIRQDIVLRSGGKTGWAIRKGSPLLEAEIQEFFRNVLEKYGVIRVRLAEYKKWIRQLDNPTEAEEWKRFEQTIALFEKYGEKYRFDPLMFAAQGYQESALDQSKRNPTGATGIMQIMPATGASLGVGDISEIEPNIHAGAKYMDQLISRYFPGEQFDEQNRTLFAFASYNAGPGKIQKMRRAARERGLDPDRWFNNVELVAAEKSGLQVTTYVRNIYKYYVAYKLTLKQIDEKRKARGQTPTSAPPRGL